MQGNFKMLFLMESEFNKNTSAQLQRFAEFLRALIIQTKASRCSQREYYKLKKTS